MKFLALSALIAAAAAAPASKVSAMPVPTDVAQAQVIVIPVLSIASTGGPPSISTETVTATLSELAVPTTTLRTAMASFITLVDSPNDTSYIVPAPSSTADVSASEFRKPLGALPPYVLHA